MHSNLNKFSEVVNEYYPFGMLTDRSVQAGQYRYGMNGQEKVDEISGNNYTAMFWEYDPRLGRRWNQDPKPNPSISNYAAFANNPIWFTDKNGDTLDIDNSAQAKADIKTLTGKYSDVVTFDDNGRVGIDWSNAPAKAQKSEKRLERFKQKAMNEEGFVLINELVNTDGRIFYGTESPVGARDRNSLDILDIPFPLHPPGFETEKPHFFLNMLITPYSESNPYILPKAGYDGQVMIAKGSPYIWQNNYTYDSQRNITGTTKTLVKISRYGIIYHELRENYLRTCHGMNYKEAHEEAGGIGKIGKFIFE
jgi:RHS repeat-associated protein